MIGVLSFADPVRRTALRATRPDAAVETARPFPEGKNEPGATRPVGVTEEHLMGQKTARFSGVAPGTMRGALVASVVGAEGRLTQ